MTRIRLLYAEDNPSDADLTRSFFEYNTEDFEFHVVDSGQQCLLRLQQEQFDALLIDNKLRDMDATSVLKSLCEFGAPLPIVVVTATGDETLVVQVLRMGACDYVAKQGNYLETLPEVLRNAVRDFHHSAEHTAHSGRIQRKILYVEHHAADIDLTLKHLHEAAPHLHLEVARTAAAGIAVLENDNFDLVLADLRLPDMSALEFLHQIKQRGRAVPFVIITGRGDEAAAIAALKLGASDYLIKREDYLTQLPYAIDNAIARSQLAQMNRRLQVELAERERTQGENARLLDEVLGQRQRLDEMIASVPGVVWEAWSQPESNDLKPGFVSDQIERMLGYQKEDWLSTPNFWSSIIHPDDRARAIAEASEFFATGVGGISQFRWTHRDGHEMWAEVRTTRICDEAGNPIGLRGVTMDITSRKQAEKANAVLEEQLRQSQKMESVGRLAGGVAHDFNNLLTVINGYADLMLLQVNAGDPLQTGLTQIVRAGKRAAELTRQLLAFSRRQLLQPRVFVLNSLIADSMKMLQRLLGEDIELVTVLDKDLGQIRADPGQMDQVVLNLAINARDAMPRGGRLTIETRNVTLDNAFVQRHATIQPGAYVMLGISDNGCGMDSETLSRLFEPFFTTKEKGKGTGLGLSTVYGIVQQSGGSIWVYSEPGRGTSFKIYLPRVEAPSSLPEERRSDADSLHGAETILVVEDEEMVLKLTAEALRKSGYEVIEASNAGEALLACERHIGPIPLMITDVVMPQMSGRELAERLLQIRPEMRILYMSGYTDDSVVRHGLLDPHMFFLEKPFTPQALSLKVREVLDLGALPLPSS